MSDYGSPPAATAEDMRRLVAKALDDQAALKIPAYMVADLPSASSHPNAIVRIMDNPQGQASSNGVVWLSDVDGSNLGPGDDNG